MNALSKALIALIEEGKNFVVFPWTIIMAFRSWVGGAAELGSDEQSEAHRDESLAPFLASILRMVATALLVCAVTLSLPAKAGTDQPTN
jgi:hypothetical protein